MARTAYRRWCPAVVMGCAAGGVLRDGAVELGILEFATVGCIGCGRHLR
jgi:hypothetical protein